MAKKYRVLTTYTFSGQYIVEAESADQAYEMVNKDCGLILGSTIHSSLPDEVIDWKFDVHPRTTITTPLCQI